MRFLSTVSILFLFFTSFAHASSVKFGFQHPSFGGNPFNANFMLPMAEKQNAFKPKPTKRQDLSQEEQFKQELQRRLLSGAIDKIVRSLYGEDGELTDQVHYQVDDFEITITPSSDGASYSVVIDNAGSITEIVVDQNGLS